MAHRILALFLFLSSYISFSTSKCRVYDRPWKIARSYPIFIYHDTLICSEINLNKEIQLNKEYNSSDSAVSVVEIVNSNISNVYNNAFDGFPHIELAILSNISLREIEFFAFRNWTLLKILDLSYNELTSIDFSLPKNVMHLCISHNKISHLKQHEIYDGLIKLDLSYNFIISIENFGPFNALRYLDLSHNNLSSLSNITWQNGQNLDFLSLSHNNLEYVPKIFERILVNSLDLSYNNISTFDCTNVTKSINLSYNKFIKICNISSNINKIDFSNNEITNIYEQTFKKKEKLEYLNLSSNHIETIYPGAFHDLVKLKHLDLSDNVISELPMGLFYHLGNLINLSIAMNHIEKLEHGIFTGLNTLRILNVSDNKIDNLDAIYSLKNLLELNIVDNYLYQLDVDQIAKHLSNLSKIRFNIPSVSCEELMVYLLEFKTKRITVEKGDSKYQENLNGIYCHSDSDIKIKKQDTDEGRLEYIANYLSGINVALIVILVVLVFVIISTLFTLYQVYVKHGKQTVIDQNVQSRSLKLLSENDSLN